MVFITIEVIVVIKKRSIGLRMLVGPQDVKDLNSLLREKNQ